MNTAPVRFKAPVDAALADPTLKIAIERTTGTAERKRAAALPDFPQFEAARERGKRIKEHVIANLDHYLVEFERNAVASGATVHWAATASDASRIVVELCRKAGAKPVTRVKSMLGEEIGLPHALACGAALRCGRPARCRPSTGAASSCARCWHPMKLWASASRAGASPRPAR